jgi:hypothetical protein
MGEGRFCQDQCQRHDTLPHRTKTCWNDISYDISVERVAISSSCTVKDSLPTTVPVVAATDNNSSSFTNSFHCHLKQISSHVKLCVSVLCIALSLNCPLLYGCTSEVIILGQCISSRAIYVGCLVWTQLGVSIPRGRHTLGG